MRCPGAAQVHSTCEDGNPPDWGHCLHGPTAFPPGDPPQANDRAPPSPRGFLTHGRTFCPTRRQLAPKPVATCCVLGKCPPP